MMDHDDVVLNDLPKAVVLNDSHSIQITGKHNIDLVTHGKYKRAARLQASTVDMKAALIALPTSAMQLAIVQDAFAVAAKPALATAAAESVFAPVLLKELRQKIHGYKAQDVRRALHDPVTLITLAAVLEKLALSRLTCCYCNQAVVVFYQLVREPTQWTLDRVDNEVGHTAANTVMACLKCNLQRRRIDEAKFMFTKKLKIQKSLTSGFI